MQVVIDTSALIRFFTNDSAEKALKVKNLLEKEKNIIIPDVVFPELEYVLSEQYNLNRQKILEIFQFLVSQNNIKLSIQIKKAINIFEKSKLDFADCIIAAHSLKGKLASFDKELLKIDSVKSFWK